MSARHKVSEAAPAKASKRTLGSAVSTAAASAVRAHTLLPHTADAGFEVTAGDLPGLFEEAAVALAELGAGPGPDEPPAAVERIMVSADDLPGLAFAWLNELIALGDIGHGVIADVAVERLERPGRGRTGQPWRLDARVGVHPYGRGGARAIRQVKAATYHGLAVERTGDRWLLRAYLDL